MDKEVLISPKSPTPTKVRSYTFRIFHLAFAMGLISFGYITVITFQTQLNKTIGSIGMTSNYIIFAISCNFAPKVVNCLGVKRSIAIFALGYVVLALANLYPAAYVFIPVNMLNGFTGAIFWCAEASYLGKLAMNQSIESGLLFESITSYYNGIMFCFIEICSASGNASASFILTHFDKKYLYIVLASVCLIAAIVFALMGDPVPMKPEMKESNLENLEPRSSETPSFLQTIHLIQSSKEMKLIIFPCFYAGVTKSFVAADFTKFVAGYIVGVEKSGYVTCGFFIMAAFTNVIAGKLASTFIKRKGIFFIDFVMHMTLFILLLVIKLPFHDTSLLSFIKAYMLTAFLACGNGVSISQPMAIVQSFYLNDKDRNSGVSNALMSQTLGMSVVFMISIFVNEQKTFWIKLVFMIVCQVISTACVFYCDLFVKPIDGRKPERVETVDSVGGSFFSSLSTEQIGEFMVPTIAEEDLLYIQG